MTSKTRINPEAIAQCALLFGLVIVFWHMIFGGLHGKFLHPRFIPFTGGAFLFLIVLVFARVPYLFGRNAGIPIKLKYFLFIGFVALFLASPKGAINTRIAELRGVSVDDSTFYSQGGSDSSAGQGEGIPAINPDSAKEDAGQDSKTSSGSADSLPEVLADYSTFVPALDEVFGNPKKYEGRTIAIRGFKFHAKDLQGGRFLIARLAITCCVADAQPIGIACAYVDSPMLVEKKYYELAGIIRAEMTDLYGETRLWPFVEVKSHKSIDPPEYEYLYVY